MAKEPSRLQLAQEKAEAAAEKTNQKINELGEHTNTIYTTLITIQSVFDNIRNVPEESKLRYEKLKAIRVNWKQQADKIEVDYKKASVKSASGAAAGVSAGVAVATLGPTAAMGIATTFGVASTGTAISTLSGAAATNAALAWLGGGALTAGGGGMAAGSAVLALAGPFGWGIAGVATAASMTLFFKSKSDKERLENIYTLISNRDVKSYELATVELSERINRIKDESSKLVDAISKIAIFGTDYNAMSEAQQYELGSYVNLMESSIMLLVNPILGLQPKYTKQDFDKLCDDGVKTPIFADLKETLLIDSVSLRHYLKTDESLIITLANLLYKVTLDEKDKEVLLKSLKKNKDFLVSVNISKGELTPFALSVVEKALEYRYMY